jgi:hypothetical protein
MPIWRIYGHVMAKRRSSHGLHLVLHGRRIEFYGFRRRNVPYLLVLCTDCALSDALEARLRVYDLVRVAGVIEPRTRPQSPIIKRDWDMIVTEARVPRLSNFCRRLWACPSQRDPVEDDDAQSSSL